MIQRTKPGSHHRPSSGTVRAALQGRVCRCLEKRSEEEESGENSSASPRAQGVLRCGRRGRRERPTRWERGAPSEKHPEEKCLHRLILKSGARRRRVKPRQPPPAPPGGGRWAVVSLAATPVGTWPAPGGRVPEPGGVGGVRSFHEPQPPPEAGAWPPTPGRGWGRCGPCRLVGVIQAVCDPCGRCCRDPVWGDRFAVDHARWVCPALAAFLGAGDSVCGRPVRGRCGRAPSPTPLARSSRPDAHGKQFGFVAQV